MRQSKHGMNLKRRNEMSNNNSSSNGIGFAGLLTIVFITLKLIGKIDWSWWWILSPIWITAAFVLLCVVVWVVIALIIESKK